MKLNILIGGKAGQGINKVSEIVSNVLVDFGYYTFNYRDYQSLIRGGHNFNVLTISDESVFSNESRIDILVALDDRTLNQHKKDLKKEGAVIKGGEFESEGRNLNVALAGVLLKLLGVPFENLESEIKSQFKESEAAIKSAKKGYDSRDSQSSLRKQNNKGIKVLSGSEATAIGARNSNLDLYIAYPMTPATNAMHEIAVDQMKNHLMVFQGENEIGVVSMALGSSFAGARTMVGTSGGGFDLMSESLSLQGISGIPLTVYLVSRPGPGTGVPTYTSQADLDIALRAGHGEFSRVVVAPGNPVENIEKVNEALFLAEKFGNLSVVLSDKHLAESEFSSDEEVNKALMIDVKRKLSGKSIVKASSYEVDSHGNSTEDALLVAKNVEKRVERYEMVRDYVLKNFETIKIYGNKDSKNLVIGWGSTSGAIRDAIKGLDAKFLQVLYMKPMSAEVKREIERAKNVVLVENNVTGQLGRLIREKTGIQIMNRILRYDSRPFSSDLLEKEIRRFLK